MANSNNIFGCFSSGPSINYDASQAEMEKAEQQSQVFRDYIWGEGGIDKELKRLNRNDYGEDLALILFQFYLNPMDDELQGLKEIENYRKNERSIGIPIIVNDSNFFNKPEKERYAFLKQSILNKMELLESVIEKKNLDTKIGPLKSNLENLLNAIV